MHRVVQCGVKGPVFWNVLVCIIPFLNSSHFYLNQIQFVSLLAVLVSVNFGCFSPSRFSHFHCNTMRICTQISKTSTPPVLSLRLVCSTTNPVYYRSQQSCGKAMLLHLSVILSTRGLCPKGLCPGGFCPGGLCPGVLDPGRVSVQGVSVLEDPPAATVQLRAGGTHPTGMHSCFVLLLFCVFSQLIFGVNCCPWWAIVSKLKKKQ